MLIPKSAEAFRCCSKGVLPLFMYNTIVGAFVFCGFVPTNFFSSTEKRTFAVEFSTSIIKSFAGGIHETEGGLRMPRTSMCALLFGGNP